MVFVKQRALVVLLFLFFFSTMGFAQLIGKNLECAPRVASKSIDVRVSSSEGAAARYTSVFEGTSLDITSSLVLNVENITASVACDEACGAIVSGERVYFSVVNANGSRESFATRRENDFVVVGGMTLWVDKVTVAGECSIKCSDGTFSGACSANKPLYCSHGVLVNKSSVCGCPAGLGVAADDCLPFLCADGTPYGKCSSKKPSYCEAGVLVNKSSACGCPLGYNASEEECSFPKCSDGTNYGKCSADKPLYCEGGVLVNKSSVCGCPAGTTTYRNSCRKPECSDGTPFGECSYNKPFYCNSNGVLSKKATICECPRDYDASEDECQVKKCVDGTPYNECSASKPRFCFNGTFVEDPVACGCPENYIIGAVGCVPVVSGVKGEEDNTRKLAEEILKYLAVVAIAAGIAYFVYDKYAKRKTDVEETEKWISGEQSGEKKQDEFSRIGELPKKKK
ncbi:hypothetical protein HY992_01165 [Candidatus Micrarchaeota archaeon]|nr:hypothetical protein [Candidatus Micrarchaeota archaeon]